MASKGRRAEDENEKWRAVNEEQETREEEGSAPVAFVAAWLPTRTSMPPCYDVWPERRDKRVERTRESKRSGH